MLSPDCYRYYRSTHAEFISIMFDEISLISIVKIRSDSFARLQFSQNSFMIK